MPHHPGHDPTNTERQARHRARRRAILAALAAPVDAGAVDASQVTASATDLDELDREGVKTAIRKLQKFDLLLLGPAPPPADAGDHLDPVEAVVARTGRSTM